ncbi:hypothetical protein, partial [Hominenteromicrobium sp.]|uniref:hypothetical protein n=1 Tax=Hominenteromicrobium sp. TaxID=3073581 RepID=UPI003AF0FCAD
ESSSADDETLLRSRKQGTVVSNASHCYETSCGRSSRKKPGCMGFLNKTPKCLILYALSAKLFPEFLLIFPKKKVDKL